MKRSRIRLETLGVALVTLLASCSGPEPVPLGAVDIETAYGTLEFGGSVELFERGGALEYHAALEATFRPDEEVNRVPAADLSRYFLVATAATPPGEPSRELGRDEQAIAVRLSENGETAPLPEHTFRIPKSVAEEAAEIRLAVSDGRIMWPIADLK